MLLKKCKSYPCHKEEELEDCTECFCRIYPCGILELGTLLKVNTIKVNEYEKERYVWDCSKCVVLHKKENIDIIKKIMLDFVKEKYEKKE